MTAATKAVERAGEAASIAIALMAQGDADALADAVIMVFEDVIKEPRIGAIDQRECSAPPCPALLRTVGSVVGALQDVTGQLAVELLAGLVAAVRRLAELEGVPPAEAVRRLVAGLEGGVAR